MPWDDDTITPKVLLQHMQGMKHDLTQQMHGMQQDLTVRLDRMDGRMDGMEGCMDGMNDRMGGMEKDIRGIKTSLQRLYSHRVDMLGRIENLEEVTGVAQ